MDSGNHIAQIIDGLISRDRRMLSKAITLVESRNPRDRQTKTGLMRSIQVLRKPALRIGITGSPGVGKSTFLNGLITRFRDSSSQVAILTIDPSSTESGGSILGDKLRMNDLIEMDNVFIRPSPSKGHLGGIHLTTWETVQLCEATGFDYIFIETVGVGQSEFEVRNLVNETWYLTMARSGDEIQAIKRGILDVVDRIIITKADLDPDGAKNTRALLKQSLKTNQSGKPKTAYYTLSPLQPDTLRELWEDFKNLTPKPLNDNQLQFWYRRGWQEMLHQWAESDPRMNALYTHFIQEVGSGETDYWSAIDHLEDELSEIWNR